METKMTFAFTVTVQRRGIGGTDSSTYTVAAETAERAITKALRQARIDSGYQRIWKCTALSRGGWIVS
jgi:hypothetical protein